MIADRRDFRLAKTVRPTRYELRFDLDLDEWRSTGQARIDIHMDAAAREIVLHAVELDITMASIDGGPALQDVSYDDEAQTATLRFGGEIPAAEHRLNLE